MFILMIKEFSIAGKCTQNPICIKIGVSNSCIKACHLFIQYNCVTFHVHAVYSIPIKQDYSILTTHCTYVHVDTYTLLLFVENTYKKRSNRLNDMYTYTVALMCQCVLHAVVTCSHRTTCILKALPRWRDDDVFILTSLIHIHTWMCIT